MDIDLFKLLFQIVTSTIVYTLGKGIMPAQKPKRGRRSFLVRKKNFERKHQANIRKNRLLDELSGVPEHSTNKENEPPQVCPNEQGHSLSGVIELAPRDNSVTLSQENSQSQVDDTAQERSLVGGCSRDHPNSEFEALGDELKHSALPEDERFKVWSQVASIHTNLCYLYYLCSG